MAEAGWRPGSSSPHANTNPPIAVGMNDSASALLAVEWAGREAVHVGCPVRLIHAYPANALYEPPGKPIGRERAEIAFEAARSRLAAPFYDGLTVTSTAFEGGTRRVLLRAAAAARMLVIGREHAGRLAELVLSSTSMSCAVHAVTPVTVVPMSWLPTDPGTGAVVLGVDGSPRCLAATEYAFALASSRRCRLFAVASLERPAGAGQDALIQGLEGWRGRFPGVEVDVVMDDRPAVDLLAEYATKADRVIIGGRGHGLVTGALLGSVARSVLRRMPCPVTVVHERRKEGEDDDDA